MGGGQILSDQIKNLIYYGIGLAITNLMFLFSEGSGFLFIIAWIMTIGILIIAILSSLTTLLALITFPLGIPLYFDKETDKFDKFLFDLSTLVGTIVCLGLSLASYQTLQQYGNIGLPEFFPLGNLFGIYNFSY